MEYKPQQNETNEKVNNMASTDTKKTVKSPASAKRAIATRSDNNKERLNGKRSELKQGLDSKVVDVKQSLDNNKERLNGQRSELKQGLDSKVVDVKRSFDDRMGTCSPLIDLTDKDNQYVLHVELPGFDKDDVDIELNKDVLTLKAEKNAESEDQSATYLYRERYDSFRRTIFFPEEVDPSKVEATMDKGILALNVTKRGPRPEERMTKLKVK